MNIGRIILLVGLLAAGLAVLLVLWENYRWYRWIRSRPDASLKPIRQAALKLHWFSVGWSLAMVALVMRHSERREELITLIAFSFVVWNYVIFDIMASLTKSHLGGVQGDGPKAE